MTEKALTATPYMPHNTAHEREQADALVRILLERGYSVSVNDGVEWVLRRSIDREAILSALGSTEADTLASYDENGDRLATFGLVYGNGPGELIADHTANHYAESIWNAWAAAVGEPT
jgi:hypothetical protein